MFEGRTGFGGVSGYCGSSLSFEYDGTVTLISRTQTSGGITTKTEYIGPYELVDGEFKAAYFDGTFYDSEKDAVTFIIPGGAFGPLGLIAHEFKHGYQFLTGEIDLSVNGKASYANLFYDIYDEFVAYERGYLFGADFFSVKDISEMYPKLPKTAMTIQSLPKYNKDWELYDSKVFIRGLQVISEKKNRAFRFKNRTYRP